MKLLFSVIGVLAALTAGLVNISNDKDEPEMFEKYYIGRMPGGYSLEMSLKIQGLNLTGSVLNTYKNITTVRGVMDEGQNFILQEFEEERVTGTYKGIIYSDGVIQGVWESPDGARRIPFKMIQEVKTAPAGA